MQFSEFQQTIMAHRYQQEISTQGVRVRTTWFPVVDMASGSTNLGHYMEFAPKGSKDWTRLDQAKGAILFNAFTTDLAWLKARVEALEALQRWMNGGPFPGDSVLHLVDAPQPEPVAGSAAELPEGAKGEK